MSYLLYCVFLCALRWHKPSQGQRDMEEGHPGADEETFWEETVSRSHVWSEAGRLSSCTEQQGLQWLEQIVIFRWCFRCNKVKTLFIPLHCSLCPWSWRCVVTWWRTGGWSTQAYTECLETTQQSHTCRRSSITRAWTISISRMMWVVDRSLLLYLNSPWSFIFYSGACNVSGTDTNGGGCDLFFYSCVLRNHLICLSYPTLVFYRNGGTWMWSAVC